MSKIMSHRTLLLGIVLVCLICSALAQSTESPTTTIDRIDWSKSELTTITVTMTNYEFSPRRLIFHHEIPTRLRLVNKGTEIYDFTAPDFFKTIILRDPGLMRSSSVGIPVDPHQQVDVDFIARKPGHFGLICADHDWAGMTADILVE